VASQLLWIDLRNDISQASISCRLSETYSIQLTTDIKNIIQLIRSQQPRIICFDFDFPGEAGLKMLLLTRNHFPELPVLMLAKEQSLELALWALRSRVWNYFVKPIVSVNFVNSIDTLLNNHSNCLSGDQASIMPQPIDCNYKNKLSSKPLPTQPAVDYVVGHCHDRLTLDSMAKLCCMSKSHFSRNFKKDHKITFQHFLIEQRINKAATLLKQSDASITEVALSVGFSDLSHFNRTFHKCVGVGPSRFRSTLIR